MSLEYEINNILKSLDNIDDSFHVDMEEEDIIYDIDRIRNEEAKKIRAMTSDITDKCYDLLNFLRTRGLYEDTL